MHLLFILLAVIAAFNAVGGKFTKKDKKIIVLKAKELQSRYRTLVQSHAESHSIIQDIQPQIPELEDFLSFHNSENTSSIHISLEGKTLLHRYQQAVQLHNDLGDMIQDLQPTIQHFDDLLSIDVAQSTLPITLATQKALSGPGTLGRALELAREKASELGLPRVAADIKHWLEENPGEATLFTAGALGTFAGEILSVQGLQDLGFGVKGIRAGTSSNDPTLTTANRYGFDIDSIAARVEPVIGPHAAHFVMVTWQSTGDIRIPNLNDGVRALTLLIDVAVAKCNPLKDCEGVFEK